MGIRHLQCFLLFLGLTVSFILQISLSITLVAMTDRKTANPDIKDFNWSASKKSWILSSYIFGFVIAQLPLSYVAQKYGGRITFLFSNLIASILCALIPAGATYGNWQALCIIRILQGVSLGGIFSIASNMLAKWALVQERGVFAVIVYSGVQFGSIVTIYGGGLIATSAIGWPGVFYVSAALGCIWTLIWYIWAADSADACRGISAEEKELIETSLKVESENKEPLKIPWLQIFKSRPFLALLILQCSLLWCFYTMAMQIPTYINSVFHVSMELNAFLSALPFVACFVMSVLLIFVSAILSSKQCMSDTFSRKFFSALGIGGPAICFISLGFIKSDQLILATTLLAMAGALYACNNLGLYVNHLDLSPNFSGVTMGIANFFANLYGFFSTLYFGWVVKDEKDVGQWQIVFFTAAASNLLGCILFAIFGEAKQQPWNEPVK